MCRLVIDKQQKDARIAHYLSWKQTHENDHDQQWKLQNNDGHDHRQAKELTDQLCRNSDEHDHQQG